MKHNLELLETYISCWDFCLCIKQIIHEIVFVNNGTANWHIHFVFCIIEDICRSILVSLKHISKCIYLQTRFPLLLKMNYGPIIMHG